MTTRPGRPAIPADAFNHGDHRRYNRGCRCLPCTRAASADRRRAKYFRETGRGATTNPDRAARHIHQLRAAGLTDAEIQAAGNLCPDTLYAILRHDRQIHRTTETRILRIPIPATLATSRSGARVPGIGTWRRMQTLTANGWTGGALARHLGKTKQHAEYLMRPTASGLVRQYVADEIRNLYRQLAGQRPEDHGVSPRHAQEARARAAANGWPTASYWDDDDFDNPDFTPAIHNTRLRIDQVAEDADWLMRAGHTAEQIATRLGINKSYVNKALAHARQVTAAAA